MIVIIPTYKRLSTLPWVIKSLLNCEIPNMESKPRLAIVNNYPQNNEDINVLIKQIKNQNENSNKWEWIKLDRKKTLEPIDNWYNAIFELANKDEIVFLHGDDDLFLKDSIKSRFNAIRKDNFNMLLSKAIGGFTFLKEDKAYFNSFELKKIILDEKVYELNINNLKDFSPVFIGNNVYVNNENFREIFNELKQKLSKQQDWAPYNMRTLMIPYYLPFMFIKYNLQIGGLNKICVIRGTSLSETLVSPFYVRGWNSGFLSLLAYDFLIKEFSNGNYEIKFALDEQLKMVKNWYMTFLFDKRISPDLRKNALKEVKIKINVREYINSLIMVIREILGLKNIKLRIKIKMNKHLINLEHFINNEIKYL